MSAIIDQPFKQNASGLLSNENRPIHLDRYPAPKPLVRYVEYFWSVHWQLPEGETFTSINIPFPCTHVVFEPGATGIFGPVKGSFEKVLSGSGFVLGARFKSGLFTPFSNLMAHQVAAQQWDLNRLFAETSTQFEASVVNDYRVENAIECLSQLLLKHEKQANTLLLPKANLANKLVALIEQNKAIGSVAELVKQTGMSMRALERLFKDYIGLSPKWVVRLFRLQQMADVMMQTDAPAWADLAAQLGYFDQAHCIKDFKSFTGKTPSQFIRS